MSIIEKIREDSSFQLIYELNEIIFLSLFSNILNDHNLIISLSKSRNENKHFLHLKKYFISFEISLYFIKRRYSRQHKNEATLSIHW